jgi:hypothetical protein
VTEQDVVRSFWARELESKVSSDGSVLGFAAWWSKATPHARRRGSAYALACARKVLNEKREVNECIAAGVAAFRMELRMQRMAESAKDPEYGKFRFGLIDQILVDGLRPFEVAAMLDQKHDVFPEIRDDEIDEYREWGEVWGGPIREGKLVWNARTHQLEEWPHAAVPVFKPAAEQVKAALPMGGTRVAVAEVVEDVPPEPEYADEAPPPE